MIFLFIVHPVATGGHRTSTCNRSRVGYLALGFSTLSFTAAEYSATVDTGISAAQAFSTPGFLTLANRTQPGPGFSRAKVLTRTIKR